MSIDGTIPTRVLLRPLGNPLPLGFLALMIATTTFAAVQLDWVPAAQGRIAGLAALLLAVPLQLLASVLGFLARDPVAGTGMGVLAGTWAVAGATTVTSPPGATSAGLGVVLVVAAAALLVPVAAAASGKPVAAAVMGLAAVRFAATGIAEITAAGPWMAAAGWLGLALGALALYAAFGFELEDVHGRTVLPLLRRGAGAEAISGGPREQLAGLEHDAGVRSQL